MVKFFYIDHNILVDERNWPALKRLSAPDSGFRLVMSDWNLIEIAGAADHKQALMRMEFIETLNPAWFIPLEVIQKNEVENFLRKNHYKASLKEVAPHVPHYYMSLSYDVGDKVPSDYRATDLVASWHKSPEVFEIINKAKKTIPDAMKVLQGIDKKEQKEKEEEIFRAWMGPKLPQLGLDEKALSQDQQTELLNFIWKNSDLFFKECPSIAIEDALYDIRNKDNKRPPQVQDAGDMQHSILGLSYCDYFVTRDGFTQHCAEFAAKNGTAAKVVKNIEDIQ